MGCGSGLICIKNTQVALPVTHTETKANRGVGSKDGNPTSINETYGQNGQNGNGRKLVSINIKEVPNIRSSLYLDAKAKHNA